MGIRVRVKPTFTCYHHHRRWKEGEIFEIQNMKVFSEKSMELVDKAAQPKIKEDDGSRKPTALSQGSGKALHEGKINPSSEKVEEAPKENSEESSNQAETTGDEDVI